VGGVDREQMEVRGVGEERGRIMSGVTIHWKELLLSD